MPNKAPGVTRDREASPAATGSAATSPAGTSPAATRSTAARPTATGPGADQRPFLCVVRGEPTEAELAAVVAVLAARGAAPADVTAPARAVRDGWSDRSRLMRESIAPGPGAWRRSALAR